MSQGLVAMGSWYEANPPIHRQGVTCDTLHAPQNDKYALHISTTRYTHAHVHNNWAVLKNSGPLLVINSITAPYLGVPKTGP